MEVWGGNQAVSTTLELPGLDAWLFSRPHEGAEGGGDVHYASSCAAGALSRMLVADVSGHGASVSDTARRLRKLMQRHIIQHEQTHFVRAMNSEFASLAKVGCFATAIAFTYDAPANRLQICNAGHPPPLVYSAKRKEWTYLNPPQATPSDNFPLGIDAVADYRQFEAPVATGDLLLCYTDALIECVLREGGRFDQAGFLELTRSIDVSDPGQVIPNILGEIEKVATMDDDVTMLMFRPNGNRRYIPLGARLLAPIKYLSGVARQYTSA
jgi:serine phosphatase RsbU (regulator of sigma subunit)